MLRSFEIERFLRNMSGRHAPPALIWYLSLKPDETDAWFTPDFVERVKIGDSPRAIHIKYFAWASLNYPDLQFIASYSPLIELGAGSGLYAYIMASMGADIIAYDTSVSKDTRGKDIPIEFSHSWKSLPSYNMVRKGDETMAGQNPMRTLLLIWPSNNDQWSTRAVDNYRRVGGRVIIYVGEGEGGCTGTTSFFNCLQTYYECVDSRRINSTPTVKDSIYVWKRKLSKL